MVIASKADIYSREDALYVVALALTRRGYTFETDKVQTIATTRDAGTLGAAVLQALAAYERDVPDIADPRKHAYAMLRVLGFPSLRSFERGTKLTGVQVADGFAHVFPTKPYGRGGYLGLTLDDAPDGGMARVPLEPMALGEAVLSRLAMSVPHPT